MRTKELMEEIIMGTLYVKMITIRILIGELETAYKKLEKLVPVEMRSRIKDAFSELETLSAYLKDLGVHRQLIFVPLLM